MSKKGPALDKTIQKARMLRREETPPEQRLWSALRNHQLAGLKFRRQHPYAQFVLDFFCAERLLAIELDGGVHDEAHQAEHDAARAEFFAQRGVRILRFSNDEIERHLPHVLQRIIEAAHSPSPDGKFRRERGPGGEG